MISQTDLELLNAYLDGALDDNQRAELESRLQPHAVPAAVMRHAHLPTTARGKIDRRALGDGPFESW